MKYIAYGSNMIEEQMAHRCPNARLIGTGFLILSQSTYLQRSLPKSQCTHAQGKSFG